MIISRYYTNIQHIISSPLMIHVRYSCWIWIKSTHQMSHTSMHDFTTRSRDINPGLIWFLVSPCVSAHRFMFALEIQRVIPDASPVQHFPEVFVHLFPDGWIGCTCRLSLTKPLLWIVSYTRMAKALRAGIVVQTRQIFCGAGSCNCLRFEILNHSRL